MPMIQKCGWELRSAGSEFTPYFFVHFLLFDLFHRGSFPVGVSFGSCICIHVWFYMMVVPVCVFVGYFCVFRVCQRTSGSLLWQTSLDTWIRSLSTRSTGRIYFPISSSGVFWTSLAISRSGASKMLISTAEHVRLTFRGYEVLLARC